MIELEEYNLCVLRGKPKKKVRSSSSWSNRRRSSA